MEKFLSLWLPLTMIFGAVAQPIQSYSYSPGTPGLPSTNFLSADLSARLTNLQNEMQQLLPLLAALNASSSLNNSNLIGNAGSGPGAGLTNPYGSALLPLNYTTPATASTITTLPDTPATPTSVNGTNTETLMARNGTLTGAIPAYGGFLTPAEQDTLRNLIVLQNDLERTLPLIESINGNTVSGTNRGRTAPSFPATSTNTPPGSTLR